jgi:DNA-binding CsgD family transcriptional regulator
MPHATPAARIIGRIQRLCLFGPGGPSIFPDILRELQQHIPSRIGPGVYCQGDQFLSFAVFSEDPANLGSMRIFVDLFEEKEGESEVALVERELFPTYRQRPVSDYVERRVKVSPSEWLRSDLYNVMYRPVGIERNLVASILGRSRLLASLVFPRTATDPAHSPREIRLLEAIVPSIAHALTDQRRQGQLVDSDERGQLIVDATGVVQHASPEARALLLMARMPADPVPLVLQPRGITLPDEVVRLCQRVAAWSEDHPLSTPPVWRCRNDWGELVFRVFRMEQHAGLPTPRLLSVGIERREPLRLKLLRRLGELPLSTRETELCLALLDGASRGEIAERMGVSATTAITHTRNLYTKLDVHNRMELVEKLQAM